jgi:GSH-dependent disulfide-bond oxidoreductase
MIELSCWPTPNEHNITMLLKEAGLSCAIRPVDISLGDQFKPTFRHPSCCAQPAAGDRS